VSSAITASYAKYDEPTAAGVDYKQFDIGGNVAWAPVTGLTITGELEYKNVDFANTVAVARAGLADTNALVGFIRVRRDF